MVVSLSNCALNPIPANPVQNTKLVYPVVIKTILNN
jgi:hypothetical protein